MSDSDISAEGSSAGGTYFVAALLRHGFTSGAVCWTLLASRPSPPWSAFIGTILTSAGQAYPTGLSASIAEFIAEHPGRKASGTLQAAGA